LYVYQTQLDAGQTIRTLSIASTHQLDSNFFKVLICWIWPLEQLDVTIRRSASATSAPPISTIIVSEPTVAHESEALALEIMEERVRKDLEDDRKDAECELSCYEDAGLMHEAAERTMHIVRFWEVVFGI
jgi:hypothetical protein